MCRHRKERRAHTRVSVCTELLAVCLQSVCCPVGKCTASVLGEVVGGDSASYPSRLLPAITRCRWYLHSIAAAPCTALLTRCMFLNTRFCVKKRIRLGVFFLLCESRQSESVVAPKPSCVFCGEFGIIYKKLKEAPNERNGRSGAFFLF